MIDKISSLNSPRKLPLQSRSMMTVNSILDATAHIFIKNGYTKTNTNIIAEYAGVSIGSLYQYFPNKDALIQALYQRHVGRMQKIVLKTMENPIKFEDRKSLFSMIEAIVNAHLLEPELHIKFEEIKTLERWTPADKTDSGCIQQQVMQMISALPQLNKREKNLCAFVLVHTVHSLVHAITFKRPQYVSVKALINETVNIIERYLQLPNTFAE